MLNENLDKQTKYEVLRYFFVYSNIITKVTVSAIKKIKLIREDEEDEAHVIHI